MRRPRVRITSWSLIRCRDPLFTTDFLKTLGEAGIQSVKLPPQSPNLNAYAERFVRTVKESCLDLVILFGKDRFGRQSVSSWCVITRSEIIRDSTIV